MSYIVYCIFRGPLPAALELPAGVSGYRVFTANYQGLGAAISKVPEDHAPPDNANRMAFERVVESFYRHLTIIPMRYGCRVECPYDAAMLLQGNHAAYNELLRQLEGLAEVGMQVLVDGPIAGAETERAGKLPGWLSLRAIASRAASQRWKKWHSPDAGQASTAPDALVENLCDSLHGSFVRHKVEFPFSWKSGSVSLHFLVPRDSVESFRSAAYHLPADPCVKLLLSGPWPPYNFVDATQP